MLANAKKPSGFLCNGRNDSCDFLRGFWVQERTVVAFDLYDMTAGVLRHLVLDTDRNGLVIYTLQIACRNLDIGCHEVNLFHDACVALMNKLAREDLTQRST